YQFANINHRFSLAFIKVQKQKTPTVSAIGVFALMSFVNQKLADFVLSVQMAPRHFLVDYSG
uniref:hypothetical protein n=1 Tax=Salmonella enterica TaxID=28901 RepID=UPI003F662323